MRYEPLDHAVDGRRLVGTWAAVSIVLFAALGGLALDAAGIRSERSAARAELHAAHAPSFAPARCG